jgi:hypothetical protein
MSKAISVAKICYTKENNCMYVDEKYEDALGAANFDTGEVACRV